MNDGDIGHLALPDGPLDLGAITGLAPPAPPADPPGRETLRLPGGDNPPADPPDPAPKRASGFLRDEAGKIASAHLVDIPEGWHAEKALEKFIVREPGEDGVETVRLDVARALAAGLDASGELLQAAQGRGVAPNTQAYIDALPEDSLFRARLAELGGLPGDMQAELDGMLSDGVSPAAGAAMLERFARQASAVDNSPEAQEARTEAAREIFEEERREAAVERYHRQAPAFQEEFGEGHRAHMDHLAARLNGLGIGNEAAEDMMHAALSSPAAARMLTRFVQAEARVPPPDPRMDAGHRSAFDGLTLEAAMRDARWQSDAGFRDAARAAEEKRMAAAGIDTGGLSFND